MSSWFELHTVLELLLPKNFAGYLGSLPDKRCAWRVGKNTTAEIIGSCVSKEV
jgi:hypothetical protein